MGEGMEGVGQGPWGKQGSDTIDTDLHAEGGGLFGDRRGLRGAEVEEQEQGKQGKFKRAVTDIRRTACANLPLSSRPLHAGPARLLNTAGIDQG